MLHDTAYDEDEMLRLAAEMSLNDECEKDSTWTAQDFEAAKHSIKLLDDIIQSTQSDDIANGEKNSGNISTVSTTKSIESPSNTAPPPALSSLAIPKPESLESTSSDRIHAEDSGSLPFSFRLERPNLSRSITTSSTDHPSEGSPITPFLVDTPIFHVSSRPENSGFVYSLLPPPATGAAQAIPLRKNRDSKMSDVIQTVGLKLRYFQQKIARAIEATPEV